MTYSQKILALLLTLAINVICAAEKKFYTEGPSSRMEFALTYDDGPGAITDDLLALLKKHGAAANFFVLGKNARKYPEKLKKIAAEGHLLGSHTYSHASLFAMDKKPDREKILRDELLKSETEFYRIGLSKPSIIRFPNGFNRKWAVELAASMGYCTVTWTYGADWQSMPEEKMTENYIKALRPGAIILLHDAGGKDRRRTLRITDALLLEAARKGLKPARLDDLLGLRKMVNPGTEPLKVDTSPAISAP